MRAQDAALAGRVVVADSADEQQGRGSSKSAFSAVVPSFRVVSLDSGQLVVSGAGYSIICPFNNEGAAFGSGSSSSHGGRGGVGSGGVGGGGGGGAAGVHFSLFDDGAGDAGHNACGAEEDVHERVPSKR
jgi:hypothetical protein